MTDKRSIFGLAARDRSLKFGLQEIWEQLPLTKLSRIGVLWHLYLHAWRGLIATPLSSALTALTIAGSLALLAGFLLIIENVQLALVSSQSTIGVNIYLNDNLEERSASDLREQLAKRPEVEEAVMHTKHQAMAEFKRSLADYSYLLDGLDGQNPLPASIDLKIRSDYLSDLSLRKLTDEVAKLEGVERAVYNEGSLSQLTGIMQVFRRVGGFAVLFMLAITGFIIMNTIKLAVASEQHEIEIMRLVGATESLIQAPYLIEGFIEGVLGSAVGVLIVYGLFRLVKQVITTSPFLQLFFDQINFLTPSAILLVVCTGILVGVGGSAIALRQGRA